MAISLETAIDRIVEIQKEILVSLGEEAHAVEYFSHHQTKMPYWTNRVGRFTIPALEEDLDYPTYTVVMRLVIAHVSENYDGASETNLQTWIPTIVQYFHQRPRLQSDTNNSGLDNLLHAQITGGTGLTVLQNYGSIGSQIGVEFTLSMEFVEEIDMAYS